MKIKGLNDVITKLLEDNVINYREVDNKLTFYSMMEVKLLDKIRKMRSNRKATFNVSIYGTDYIHVLITDYKLIDNYIIVDCTFESKRI